MLAPLSCRLTRFLVVLFKSSQETTRRTCTFVPKQNRNRQ